MIIHISAIPLIFNVLAYGFTPTIKKLSAYTSISTNSNPLHASSKPNTPRNEKKDFQQYGEIDPFHCTLSKEEILILIKERKKARRSRNFDKADDLLARLNSKNVFLDDAKKLWRADGEVFDLKGFSSTIEYTKSPTSKLISELDEEYVIHKLKERSKAKFRRDFDNADDILDELRFMKNVSVDDDTLTWKVVDGANSLGNRYVYGGKRLNNLAEEEILKIEELVKIRGIAKTKKDYNVADRILHMLEIDHGVRVDDAKKAWFFLPKFDNGSDVSNDKRGQRDKQTNKNREKENPRQIIADWSEVESTMPDGISIDTDKFEPILQDISTPPQMGSTDNLSEYTVNELKGKLRAAGLPLSGKKSDLIDRLMDAHA